MQAITFTPMADGSLYITGHKRPIRISAGVVARDSFVRKGGHPVPSECWNCHKQAMYVTRETRGGPELIWITYECGECGMKEREPFD